MTIIELTIDNFEQTTNSDGIVIVDVWAQWCKPCHEFAPIFDAAAEQHRDIVFAKIDADAQEELTTHFGIDTVPTLIVLRDGIVLLVEPGVLPAHALEDLIGQIREIDMDKIRRQLAALQDAEPTDSADPIDSTESD